MNRISKKNNTNKIDFLLVLIVFISTISPFFFQTKINLVVPFFLLAFVFFKRRHVFDKKLFILISIVIVLISVQGYIWGFSLLTVFTFTSFFILTPYFLYKIVGIKVFNYILKIIYISTLYSLALWFLQVTIPSFDSAIQTLKNYIYQHYSWDLWARNIIIYTVAIHKIDIGFFEIYRNSGIFHEPGAFAHWLVVGIGLNTIISKNHLNKKNLIMMIALITTFSTAGYIMLFMLILFLIVRSQVHLLFKLLTLIVFLFISYDLYFTAGFLGEKVEQHYKTQANVQLEGTYTTGRIIRLRKAIAVIEQSPIFGRGIITASAAEDPYSKYDAGTATFGLIAKYGLFFGIVFYIYLYRGIKTYISYHQYYISFTKFFFAALLVGGLSQPFLFDNITIILFFIGLLNFKNIVVQNKRKTHVLVNPRRLF